MKIKLTEAETTLFVLADRAATYMDERASALESQARGLLANAQKTRQDADALVLAAVQSCAPGKAIPPRADGVKHWVDKDGAGWLEIPDPPEPPPKTETPAPVPVLVPEDAARVDDEGTDDEGTA